ncbi:MAG: hypothetical protein QM715_03445 [Nibricoccus sp.]
MNKKQPPKGKVLLHGKGIGAVTKSDIERRARELAALAGHPAQPEFTEKYLAQAKRELSGENLPPTTDEADEIPQAISRDPSEPVAQFGHQVPDMEEPNEQTTLENLAEEGVEEAQHEQMLAARKRAQQEDNEQT